MGTAKNITQKSKSVKKPQPTRLYLVFMNVRLGDDCGCICATYRACLVPFKAIIIYNDDVHLEETHNATF